MSTSHNTEPNEKKPQPAAAGSESSNGEIPDKIVLPDECGDTLWAEVLAQQPDLSTIIHKPTGTDADKDSVHLQS